MFRATLLATAALFASGCTTMDSAQEAPVDRSAMVAALLGILLTMLVLIGLLERRNKAMLRMGYDSIAVLVAYSAGLAAILGGAFAE